MVSLKENGILSAKHVCTLAYWASHAGAKGEHIDKLGLRPDQNSGRYSSHYDKWAGVDIHQQGYYPVFLGRRLRHECSRQWSSLPARLPHEVLRDELLLCKTPADKLAVAVRENDLPSRYWSHPFVTGAPAGELVHPFCIYLDGVAYTRHDSCLGIWAHFFYFLRRDIY